MEGYELIFKHYNCTLSCITQWPESSVGKEGLKIAQQIGLKKPYEILETIKAKTGISFTCESIEIWEKSRIIHGLTVYFPSGEIATHEDLKRLLKKPA
jgi:hypothetical protein